jgi:tRNA threonylcarbamoyladenosine biosynthesis protein TsaE
MRGGEVIALRGGLGAGKTTLCKGLAVGLGVVDDVTSPTYTLVSEYAGRLRFAHFDAYRLSNGEELDAIGFTDYLRPDTVCAIEWSERVADALPDTVIVVELTPSSGDERIVRVAGLGEGLERVLSEAL